MLCGNKDCHFILTHRVIDFAEEMPLRKLTLLLISAKNVMVIFCNFS